MNRKKVLSLVMVLLLLQSVAFTDAALAITPLNPTILSRVTGDTLQSDTYPNPNQTRSRYDVGATDIGCIWDKGNGEYFIVFGDTNNYNMDWTRSNVLAISGDTNLEDGLSFSSMIQSSPGIAKEILPSKKINNDEQTVIPTAGITVGNRHYIHYMSVNHWGAAGQWFTNYSGIAYSDDNGQNWTKHPTARWYNNTTSWDNKFQMASFLKQDGFIYSYTTPNGRFGDVYLSRVPENAILDINSWRYFDGNGWSTSQANAKAVAVGVAGELSVAYNSYFNRYIMTYLNEDRAAIVMRDAVTPIGPWTGEKILVPGDFTGLGQYNAFIHPLSNSGTTMYFIMSTWWPDYNPKFLKVTLTADMLGDNLISEPGFEKQYTNQPKKAPWYVTGEGGVDVNLGQARTGNNNGYVRNGSGWNSLKQRVAVQPFTDYTFTGWVRTSTNLTEGYFGVRVPYDGQIIKETPITKSLSNYTQLSITFNSGTNNFVELFAGIWANGDTWLQLDDTSLTKASVNLVSQAGFEEQASGSVSSPWYKEGNAGIDINLGYAHSGLKNGFVRNNSSWNALKQEVFVKPNTNYTLKAWIKTSPNQNNGYFGVRGVNNGPIINEMHLNYALSDYTERTVTFNSGNRHCIEIYAGTWCSEDTWLQADDFSLVEN